jgi:dienelactone hydrolase
MAGDAAAARRAATKLRLSPVLAVTEGVDQRHMRRRGFIALFGVTVLLIGSVVSAMADPYLREELHIPMQAAGAGGLEALLVRPNEPGRYPLALINHGSPRSADERPDMTPWAMLPEAIEFARRGFAAVVVMRRGYGGSGGGWAEGYGGCENANYLAASAAAVADLKAAVAALSSRPDIDASRIIGVGHSAGGFATVALTADPPPGLVAAISFAGGRGSSSDDEVCRADRLIEAFHAFGARSRIPMLWVYAENDHFFAPALAQRLKQAFQSGGGRVDFITAPAFGSDGHQLFSRAGIPIWTPYVEAFLQKQNMMPRQTLLPPPPRPPFTAPKVLSADGRNAFETYLISAPHRAFAVSPDGYYGWRTGQRTAEAASAGAMQLCGGNARHCSVVFFDETSVAANH